MEILDICGARLQGATLAPLAGLTGLKELYLAGNGISDISPKIGGQGRTMVHIANSLLKRDSFLLSCRSCRAASPDCVQSNGYFGP